MSSLIEGVDNNVLVIVIGLLSIGVSIFVSSFLWKGRDGEGEKERRIQEEILDKLKTNSRNKRRTKQDEGTTEDATNRPRESDLQCPICMDIFSQACETCPCGHSFCGSCLLNYWTRLGKRNILHCPVDRSEVHMIVSSHTIRNLVSGLNHLQEEQQSQAESEEEEERIRNFLNEYNSSFAGRSFKSFILLGWNSFLNALSNPSSLRLLHRMYLIVSLVLIIGYLLFPLDLIPEGALGAFFVIGFIDDILVALIIIVVVGNVIRVANQQ